MTMEDFVTFEVAKKLEEKGYPQHIAEDAYIVENYGDDECSVGERLPIPLVPYHMDDVAAPTVPQVLKWLRNVHHLHFEVVGTAYGYNLIISDTPNKGGTDRYYSHAKYDGPNDGGAWDEYEDCVMYGIEYVLDNLI